MFRFDDRSCSIINRWYANEIIAHYLESISRRAKPPTVTVYTRRLYESGRVSPRPILRFLYPQVDRWKTPRPPPYDSPLGGLDLFSKRCTCTHRRPNLADDYSGRVRSSPGDEYRLSIICVCVQDESGMSRQVWWKKMKWKWGGNYIFFFFSFFLLWFEIIVNKYRKLLEEIFFYSTNGTISIYFYLFLRIDTRF